MLPDGTRSVTTISSSVDGRLRGRTAMNKSQSSIAPIDPGKCVKITMFLLGIGSNISPNALLLCSNYYSSYYKNISKLIYYIMPIYSISSIIFIIIMIKWGNKLPFLIRIICGYILSAIALLGIIFCADSISDIIIFLCFSIIGITSSILSHSILGFSNILDSSYQNIHISGKESSGIFATILCVILRFLYNDNNNNHIYQTYLIIISIYCIICSILFITIRCTNYVRHKLNIYILKLAKFTIANKPNKIINDHNNMNQQLIYSDLANIIEDDHDDNIDILTQSVSGDNIYPSTQESYENMESSSSQAYGILPVFNQSNNLSLLTNSLKTSHNINKSSLVGLSNNNSLNSNNNNNNKITIPRKTKTYSSLLFWNNRRYNFFTKLFRKIKSYCFIILCSNILTWSVIPGLISGKIRNNHESWENIILMSEYFVTQYFGQIILSSPNFWWICCKYDNEIYRNTSIVVISVKNCGVFPLCCGKRDCVIDHIFLIILCVIRVLLIYPVFIYLYWNLNKNHYNDTLWIPHILMIITGLSQGYLYHLTFELAPQFVEKHKCEAIISVLRFFHFIGIAIGSSIALCMAFVVEM